MKDDPCVNRRFFRCTGVVLIESSQPDRAEQILKSVERLTESNGQAALRFGARMLVLCQFVDAVLPQLSIAQRTAVTTQFRRGVETVLSFTDDVALPAAYYATLLEQTNVLLTALETEGAA
ncbi:hypothetical protein FAZ95_38665 [Trinickia violacea]|uniref:Uncharacterized protein n=1 Tax=Trinickia violacea TaxID=2571746 RepID=A0A4P8J1M9_9BURK|nr:hypothetical protein [Trinickia violacea]QCP54777.1 hypothetical protein FAZ95_38665 [Trinickia violacea]